MLLSFYQSLHSINNGFFLSKALRNRGRTRNFFSQNLTKLMREKLKKVENGSLKLPTSGTHGTPPVSLTSWLPRYSSLPLVLLNLLEQDLLPSRIIVWLASKDYDSLDKNLISIFEQSIVEFRRTKNFGSHKKWLPLTLSSNDPFVICDDDIFYPSFWYRSLIESDDGQTYIAHRCHRLEISPNKDFLPYEKWDKDIEKSTVSSHRLFAVGCGGALIYPERISSRFRDWETIARLCPKNDDIWLKLAHFDSKIPSRKSFFMFPCLEYTDTQEVGLLQTNVNLGGNDRQIKQSLTELQLNLDFISF